MKQFHRAAILALLVLLAGCADDTRETRASIQATRDSQFDALATVDAIPMASITAAPMPSVTPPSPAPMLAASPTPPPDVRTVSMFVTPIEAEEVQP